MITSVVLITVECDRAVACRAGERFTFDGDDLGKAIRSARAAGWSIRRGSAVCAACKAAS